jgi:putative ABC transport system permease protein
MFRTTLKSVNAHKRRLLATCTAVLLGVAFLSGTLVLGDTMRANFTNLFEESNAGIDAEVRSSTELGSDEGSQRAPLDASLVGQIEQVDGVAAAVPDIQAAGQIVGSDGDPLGGNGPPTSAGNWIENPDINPYQLAEGRAPEAPGEVVIDRGAAKDGDLAVGDTVEIRTPEPLESTIVGIATFGTADSAGPVTFAAFTTEYAQQVLMPQAGKVTDVLVAADDGISQTELVDRLRTALPQGTEALTGAQLTAEMNDDIGSDFLDFFETFLLVFAGVALLVATFSIYNTFSILVAQRTRESALLRALGASRRQVLTSMTVEALFVGVIASAVGIAGGMGLASALIGLFRSAGLDLPGEGLVLNSGTVVTGMIVGVLVTLAASAIPAIKASRVAPLAALRDVAVDRTGASLVRAIIGVLITGGGVALTIAGTVGDGALGLSGLGALLTVVGVVMLGPVAARPASGMLGRLLTLRRRRNMSGVLARRNAMRNPRRTAGTASALMVGVAVVTLFTVVAASLKSSVDEIVSEQFAGDLVIESDSFASGMDPRLAGAIGELPEVDESTGFSIAPMVVGDDETDASVVEPAALGRMLDLDVTQGSFEDMTDRQVALDSDYATEHRLALGDPVPLAFADGATEDMTVGAIYENDELMDNVIVPKAVWEPHSATRVGDLVVLITVADGFTTDEAQRAIQPVADQLGAPDVQDRDEYIDSAAGEVDQMLTIVYALLVMAIIIALMGIANTLSLSVHERTRELGLLRAVGQTRRQLRKMVRGESIVVALFGAVGGLALGSFLGWAMFQAIAASEGFGSFAVPTGQLAMVLLLGGVVGMLAAVRPARRAAKLNVLEAIATD